MSYRIDELSVDGNNPVELYLFKYYGRTFAYTSSQYAQTVSIDGAKITFNPEYIERGDSLRLGNVTDKTQRNNVNKVCFNTFFFGENINWEEVLK